MIKIPVFKTCFVILLVDETGGITSSNHCSTVSVHNTKIKVCRNQHRLKLVSVSLQIGRSTENPIDFVVTDTVPGGQSHADGQTVQSTISRFACRIICQRTPPYSARIYAAGFDASKNIFLGVGCTKWCCCRWFCVIFQYERARSELLIFHRRRRPSGGCRTVKWTD